MTWKPETKMRKFLERIDASGGTDSCWPWTGDKVQGGYGRTGHILAHRLSWELHFGIIPLGKVICHRCDNPPCCNPAHLFIGTASDNVRDAIAKKRLVHPSGTAHPRWKGGPRPREMKGMSKGDQHYSRTSPHKLSRGDRHFSRLHPEKIAKGESHGMAKLNAAQVLEIREMVKQGAVQARIAAHFEISPSTVSAIIKGRLWGSL